MRISDWSSDVCSSDLLAGFAGHLAEPGIGIAGHTLLYEDGTIQHAGVVVGAYDAADNGQTAFTIEEGGYFGLARITREVSAVTGAFMAVRRAVFERLGGFDERDFAINFNDVDLFLRAGRAGHTTQTGSASWRGRGWQDV